MSDMSASGVTMGTLDSFFVGLINNIMTVEQQPLDNLKTKQDQISVRKGAYSDLSTRLNNLQQATWAIQNTSTTSIYLGNQASVTGAPTGSTVVTASASSDAMAGKYDISLIGAGLGLAAEHRVRSDQQLYADQALGWTGSFVIGGATARSHASDTTNVNVTAFGVSAPASGQTELGTDNYKVETRQDPNNSAWYQFRLVGADGNAVSIQQGTTGVYSGGWQAIPTDGGTYDTGRGLTMTFAASGYTVTSGVGAANTSYSAQGAQIDVVATDSLSAIANKINTATYGAGDGVAASVVDRQLVLASKSTGLAHTLHAGDTSGTILQQLGVLNGDGVSFKNEMQTARDAVFTVNGLQVTRSSNTNLTDVIGGMSISLAADAAGKSATINVATDTGPARKAIDSFIANFNTLTSYLADRTGISSNTVNGVTTYTRGSLNGDSVFGDLRQSLFSVFMNDAANSGALTNLRQIGLRLDDNLQISVSDSAKLETALTSDFSNTKKLIDAVATQVDAQVGRFTGKTNGHSGTTGYLTALQQSLDSENNEITNSITEWTARLTNRQQSLVNEFGQMQADLYLLQYQQQQWQSIYSASA